LAKLAESAGCCIEQIELQERLLLISWFLSAERLSWRISFYQLTAFNWQNWLNRLVVESNSY